MKGKTSILTMIGVLVYVVYALIDRFVIRISDVAAIPIIILGAALILIGIIKMCKDNPKK